MRRGEIPVVKRGGERQKGEKERANGRVCVRVRSVRCMRRARASRAGNLFAEGGGGRRGLPRCALYSSQVVLDAVAGRVQQPSHSSEK